MKTISYIIIFSTIFATISIADIINVPADIDSIQGGINLANNGDTVLVQPGIYFENINFNGKNIVVGSLMLITSDTTYISQTVIDGSLFRNPDSGSVVTFINGEDSTSILCGFKIINGIGTRTNGPFDQASGGGIFCFNNSSPSLSHLIVSNNISVSGNGAGIACWNNSNPKIINLRVTNNDGTGNISTSDGSAGIYLNNSSPIMKNVLIADNRGVISGGICCWGSCYPVLINLTISNNSVVGQAWSEKSEIFVSGDSHPIIINSVIWNELIKEILIQNANGTITISHSNIQEGLDGIIAEPNTTINWECGNIDSNPMFVDITNGYYNLKTCSPCIDVGTYFFVYNNQVLVNLHSWQYNGPKPDLGAFEFGPALGIIDELNNLIHYNLFQNYPNPFNPTTTIRFNLPKTSEVSLKIFNILGEEVATLVSENLSAGSYSYEWDASNLPSGVYLYRSEAEGFVETKKMILIR